MDNLCTYTLQLFHSSKFEDKFCFTAEKMAPTYGQSFKKVKYSFKLIIKCCGYSSGCLKMCDPLQMESIQLDPWKLRNCPKWSDLFRIQNLSVFLVAEKLYRRPCLSVYLSVRLSICLSVCPKFLISNFCPKFPPDF